MQFVILVIAAAAFAGLTPVVAPAADSPLTATQGSYVGDLRNKTLVLVNHGEYDITKDADRARLQREVGKRTIDYMNEYTKNFDLDALKKHLERIFPAQHVDQLPSHVVDFIHGLDNVEIDDYYAGKDNDATKSLYERKQMAFVMQNLFEHNPPPGGPGVGPATVSEDPVPTVDHHDSMVWGDPKFRASMKTYEAEFLESFKYQVPAPKQKDTDEGEGAYRERTDDGDSIIDMMVDIGAMPNGLVNSLTAPGWREMQADGVEPDPNNPGHWRVKPDWWHHRHSDGTVWSIPQETVGDADPYRPAPLVSGAQLMSTELDIFASAEPTTCKLGRFRQLVCNAEQKVLVVDYEHYPKGMAPQKIAEGAWAPTRDGNAIVHIENGGWDLHHALDGTPVPPPTETIVPSNHPYGNTADGTGDWDLMVIRAVYWEDIQIPIYEHNLSYQMSYQDEPQDEASAPKVKSEDVVLRMEKECDAYDTPPPLPDYIIPPLLEPPLPPTTLTREEYPLGVQY